MPQLIQVGNEVIEFPDGMTDEQISQAITGAQQQPRAPEPPQPGGLESLARGAGQGATFGFGDELSALLSSGSQMLTDPRNISSEQYRESREGIRAANEAARAANPKTYLLGEAGGSLPLGATGVGALARVPALAGRTIPTLAATGGLEGGLFGAGLSEGETAGEVTLDAAQGAAVGALAAPIVGVAGEGALRGLSAVGRAVWQKISDSPADTAKRAVRKALADDQITQAEAEAMIQAHPQLTLADLGENVGNLGRVAANVPGPGAAEATGRLTQRQYGQQERLATAARAELGDQDNYYQFVDDVVKRRADESAPLYERAHGVRLQETPGLVQASQAPAVQKAMQKAVNDIKNEPDLDLGEDWIMSTRFWDLTKQNLDDQIETVLRQGATKEARRLTKLKNSMVDEIDAQNPAYREARDTFKSGAELEDAADLGKSVFVGQKDPALISRQIKGMSAGEREAFQVGVLDSIITRVKKAGGTHNAVKRLVNSTEAKDLLAEVFPDEASVNRFLDVLDAEAMGTSTFNKVTLGSRTAPMKMQKDAFEDAMGMGGALASDMATQGAPGIATTAQGLKKVFGETLGEPEYEEVVKLLFGHLKPEARANIFRRVVSGAPAEWPAAAGRLSVGPASAIAGEVAR